MQENFRRMNEVREKGRMDFDKIWSDVQINKTKQNTRCLAINTILAGKYLVGPVLGQGGFGITYMGYDLNMETRIAIKEYFPVELVSRDTTAVQGDRVLSLSGEKSATYQQGLKKYVAEAQNVSQFSEVPGVVSVKDFFYENETAYIVMEYIDGISLKDYLKEKGGILSEEETLLIMKPVLEALEKVHSAGIIHRDISPDNIMLTFEESGTGVGAGNSQARGAGVSAGSFPASGTSTGAGSSYVGRAIRSVKLIDFGAARMTSKNDQKSLTIILKHGYAPEEQYRTHGEQGPWTDVYEVCAVLYRMLTGQTPVPAMDRLFKDELRSFAELGFALRAGSGGKAEITENTSDAILKGLAVKKEDRIQSMEELIAALYEGASVKKASGKKNGGMSAGAVAAVVLGAVLLTACIVAGVFLAGRSLSQRGNMAESLLGSSGNGQNGAAQGELSESGLNGEEVLLEESESETGRKLVERSSLTSTASSDVHAVFMLEDGKIISFGKNNYGQRNLDDWENIAALAAGNTYTAGLCEDGTVLIAGELYGRDEVERWENIVALAAGDSALYGLTAEGSLMISQVTEDNQACLDWTELQAICADGEVVCGLTKEGTIVSVGSAYSLREISDWQEVAYIQCNDAFIVGVLADGSTLEQELWTDDGVYSNDLYWDIDQDNQLKQICFSSLSSKAYYAVLDEGAICCSDYTKIKDLEEKGWKDLAGVASIYGGNCLLGVKKDGTLLKELEDSGDTALLNAGGLKAARLFNGYINDAPLLIGIGQDNQLQFYGIGVEKKLEELVRDCPEAEDIAEFYAAIPGTAMEDYAENILQVNLGDLLDMSSLEENIQELSAYTVLQPDGTLYAQIPGVITVPLDKNVKKMTVLSSHESLYSYIVGLSEEGTVQFYRSTAAAENILKVMLDSELPGMDVVSFFKMFVGEETLEQYMSIYKFFYDVPEVMQEACNWSDITDIAGFESRSLGVCGLVGLKADGTVRAVMEDGSSPEALSGWTDIVSLHEGPYAVGAIKADGTPIFLEEEPEYNYGQYNTAGWTELTDLALGTYHTVGLRADGTVYAVGKNDSGQCDVEDWQDIVYISAGDSATLGITSTGELKIAGDIGW